MVKKSTVIRIISFAAAISMVGFGFFIKEKQVSNGYKQMVENEYAKSLNSLNSSVNDITETLNKVVYMSGGSDMLSLSTKLFADGELAKDSLSNLPNGNKSSSTVYKFLSQVGNYAMSLSKSALNEDMLSKEETQKLVNLFDTSKKISGAIREVNLTYENLDDFSDIVDKKIKKDVDKNSLADSLDNLEEDLSDYPVLIYDGPFSDHILEKEPLMLKNQKLFSKQECRKKAEKTFGLKENSLQFDGIEDGKIECYRFSNDSITVSVSKYGCYIVYMRKNRTVDNTKISCKNAVEFAKRFMSGLELENMIENYYFSDEGVCVINFNYLDGKTFCYTDLIKVGVAVDTGEIMLFEAKGYLTNHTKRSFEKPKFTAEQAKKKISSLLSVKSVALALIPSDGGKEVRCYEFTCETAEKQEVLVYIDVDTLATQNIMILTKSDAGTLVK
ncbi:MAG: germination protein YpeB [Clostridia bacterium]|nr:germination protein YpeB [Clostridia bacterium]